MLKALLSLIFAVATFVAVIPALAQEEVCADQSADAVAACHSDYDCGYGNICQYGQCQAAQCWSSNQCLPWEKCDNGRCERDPWAHYCSKDSDCFGGYHCWANYCKHW